MRECTAAPEAKSAQNLPFRLDPALGCHYRPAIRTGGILLTGAHSYCGVKPMARRCELTGKNALVGNKVSHANNKTKTRFMPNLCDVSLMSDAMGLTYRLRISAIALKSVEHVGGLDAFLMKADTAKLSDKAARLKRSIARKLEAAKAA